MKKNLFVGIISTFLLASSLGACSHATGEKDKGEEYVTSVTLNFENYYFENIGDTLQLEASYTVKDGKEYKGDIEWHTSAPSIASVDSSGLVTALAGGECYITALVGYKVGKCKVVVPQKDEPAGELTFSISQTSIQLKPNTTAQLNCYLNGTDVTSGASWASSNEAVASVSAGLVTGLSDGEATITTSYDVKTAICYVKVNEGAVVEFSIYLDKVDVSIMIGGSTKINATTSEPATVSWSSSNTAVATVVDGTVNAKAVGEATITATANGKSASCHVTVTEEDDEDKVVLVRFFLDYNNTDPSDPNKMLAEFMWYQNVPLKGATEKPANPTVAADPAFPYFIGWSTHTLIDTKDDLWNMDTDVVDGTSYTLTLYGIWADVEVFDK